MKLRLTLTARTKRGKTIKINEKNFYELINSCAL